ncbi:MAG: serine/threonine protein kinase [Myxococcales bacterium]|nr:serine/threonine protein kinase [Myxococcales bacterium]
MSSPWRRLGGASDPLTEEERTDLDATRHAHDVTVTRYLAPVLLLLHIGVLLTARRPTSPGEAAWIAGLGRIHATALPAALVIGVLAWTRPPRWLGEATVVLYGAVGAAMAINAQTHNGALVGFMLSLLGTATLLRPRLSVRTAVDAGAVASVLGSILARPVVVSRDVSALTVIGVGLVAWGTARALHASAVRETRARLALERARQDLQTKVDAQVREIVARAEEIDRLNADLAVKVKERSAELGVALERLSNATEAPMLRAGAVVADRVEIVEAIGFGGMGVVYRGRDRQTGRDVAIKLVQAVDASELDAFRRFLREAQAAASVQHPAIVRVLHVDVSPDGRLFQILELVEGQSLAQRLARMGHLDWRVAVRLGEVMASGLAAAHAAGVVHRDVKPENVMLTTREPGVKLLDFGASLVHETASTGLTRPGIIIGTPEYLAPEQIVESEDIDGRADVYALGLVVYRCVAGHLPYEARNVAGWMRAHVFSRPATLKGESPPALVRLLMRCLEKSAEKRPTMEEVQVELARIADRAAVPAFHELERELAEATQEAPASAEPVSAPTSRGATVA